jgi:hypothetical protein
VSSSCDLNPRVRAYITRAGTGWPLPYCWSVSRAQPGWPSNEPPQYQPYGAPYLLPTSSCVPSSTVYSWAWSGSAMGSCLRLFISWVTHCLQVLHHTWQPYTWDHTSLQCSPLVFEPTISHYLLSAPSTTPCAWASCQCQGNTVVLQRTFLPQLQDLRGHFGAVMVHKHEFWLALSYCLTQIEKSCQDVAWHWSAGLVQGPGRREGEHMGVCIGRRLTESTTTVNMTTSYAD